MEPLGILSSLSVSWPRVSGGVVVHRAARVPLGKVLGRASGTQRDLVSGSDGRVAGGRRCSGSRVGVGGADLAQAGAVVPGLLELADAVLCNGGQHTIGETRQWLKCWAVPEEPLDSSPDALALATAGTMGAESMFRTPVRGGAAMLSALAGDDD